MISQDYALVSRWAPLLGGGSVVCSCNSSPSFPHPSFHLPKTRLSPPISSHCIPGIPASLSALLQLLAEFTWISKSFLTNWWSSCLQFCPLYSGSHTFDHQAAMVLNCKSDDTTSQLKVLQCFLKPLGSSPDSLAWGVRYFRI